jgi:hypothetical protein
MTKEQAIELANTGWWKDKTAYEIVLFQLFEEKLCMDFSAFHEALERVLGRPVYIHELGIAHDDIVKEFLGEKTPPTLDEIVSLIPEAKRILMVIHNDSN